MTHRVPYTTQKSSIQLGSMSVRLSCGAEALVLLLTLTVESCYGAFLTGPRQGQGQGKVISFSNFSSEKRSGALDVNQQGIDILKQFEENGPPLQSEVSHVVMYDTTLRDGTQGESISVSCDDKLKIAARLGSFGMDYIECGWPGSNPKDLEFFRRAQIELPEEVRQKLVAFGSTRRKGVEASCDKQIEALVESGTPTVCIVAKGHKWQVTDILRAGEEENLEMIRDSIEYLVKECGKRVFVDLEHFFDGYKFDPEYSIKCCKAAADAGAEAIVLCDTNGGSMPWEVENITELVYNRFGGSTGVTIGVHVHNDCGMAVANSVIACKAGAGMIQGTINGIGKFLWISINYCMAYKTSLTITLS